MMLKVIFLLYFIGKAFGNGFVKKAIHSASGCSAESLINQWLVVYTGSKTDCLFDPLLPSRTIISVDASSSSVNYTVFEVSSRCLGTNFNTTVYTIGNCYATKDHTGANWWVSFSLLPSLPFDIGKMGGILREDFYVDGNCQKTSSSFVGHHPSSHISLSDSKNYHCDDNYFVEDDEFELQGYFYLPRSYEDKCLGTGLPEFYRKAQNPVKLYCMTQSELDKYVAENIPQNTKKYQFVSSYYDKNCTSVAFEQYPHKLGVCLDGNVIRHSDKDRFVEVEYHSSDYTCSGSIEEYQFYYSPSPPSSLYKEVFCEFAGPSTFDHTLSVYRKMYLSDDPYIPQNIAIVQLYTSKYRCSSDISSVLANPGVSGIKFLDEQNCQVTDMYPGLLTPGQSFQGSCVQTSSGDGVTLKLRRFNQNSKCLGAYEVSEFSGSHFCGEKYGTTTFITCIPRHCNGVSQYSPDVCSGHGTCGENDVCKCNSESYVGNYCQTWKCYGTDNSDVAVCSGHGKCNDVDWCGCDKDYSGLKCDVASGISSGAVIAISILSSTLAISLGLGLLTVCISVAICGCSVLICLAILATVICCSTLGGGLVMFSGSGARYKKMGDRDLTNQLVDFDTQEIQNELMIN